MESKKINDSMQEDMKFFGQLTRRWIMLDEDIELFDITDKNILERNYFKLCLFEEMKEYHVNIISLGANCLPHTYSHGFHLSLNRHVHLPFDLQVTPLNAVMTILKNNFNNFEADGFRKDMIQNKYIYRSHIYGIDFMHDYLDLSYSPEKNISNFNSILKTRVINFDKLTKQDSLFFINCELKHDQDIMMIRKLQQVISENFPNIPLFILNTYALNKIINDYPIFTTQLPYPGYVWHRGEYFLTKSGFCYEHKIISALSHFIKMNFTKSPIARDMPTRDSTFYALGGLYALRKGMRHNAMKCLEKALNWGSNAAVEKLKEALL